MGARERWSLARAPQVGVAHLEIRPSLTCDVEAWFEIVVRCCDNAVITRPLEVRTAWNWGLNITNSCRRIMVYSVNVSRPSTQKRLSEFETRGIPFTPDTVPRAFPPQTGSGYEEYWK
ncbi:uncharacterized protein J7T54_006732 [Emericellopsis cladophorae]|uniref:Uncharacterized protein n=1 Tax=Emericellopsis cladophorae TaxID=2686198 RepID=A0A9Q0BH51_9HYPO|nr:uncharacterized protein J7T54_006732 [Emericellopsis cladophorae]KAI6784686.1 hypothetical protein J7T54_006732 [Emericellopsis cladophorae]